MRTFSISAASLAAALLLAAGTAAAAKDRPSNRGYVVGAGGVARLANDAATPEETTPADQTVSTETQAQRLVIKTKSSPPVAEPIGVNEPGVNQRNEIRALPIKQKVTENHLDARSRHEVDQQPTVQGTPEVGTAKARSRNGVPPDKIEAGNEGAKPSEHSARAGGAHRQKKWLPANF